MTSTPSPEAATPGGSPPSPQGAPPAAALRPLEAAKAECTKAGLIVIELRKVVEAKKLEVEPVLGPSEDKGPSDPHANLELAILGAQLAEQEQEEIRLARVVVDMEEQNGILPHHVAAQKNDSLRKRFHSAGNDLWTWKKQKIANTEAGAVRLLPLNSGVAEATLALYQKSDGLSKKERRPNNWRRDALDFYKGIAEDHDGINMPGHVWCNISGMWHVADSVKAAHIVPFFMGSGGLAELLFSDRAPSLERPGNALLLSKQVKSWFDKYLLVVVPADPTESPIRRWRTDIISNDIRKQPYASGCFAQQLDGKQLVFHNDNRPVSRFLYFHFVMALVRFKDLNRPGWREIWARYFEERPFATPGRYMRTSMLIAIANHFEVVDMGVVESWISGLTFDSLVTVNKDEADELARRVIGVVDNAVQKVERREKLEADGSESIDSEDVDDFIKESDGEVGGEDHRVEQEGQKGQKEQREEEEEEEANLLIHQPHCTI